MLSDTSTLSHNLQTIYHASSINELRMDDKGCLTIDKTNNVSKEALQCVIRTLESAAEHEKTNTRILIWVNGQPLNLSHILAAKRSLLPDSVKHLCSDRTYSDSLSERPLRWTFEEALSLLKEGHHQENHDMIKVACRQLISFDLPTKQKDFLEHKVTQAIMSLPTDLALKWVEGYSDEMLLMFLNCFPKNEAFKETFPQISDLYLHLINNDTLRSSLYQHFAQLKTMIDLSKLTRLDLSDCSNYTSEALEIAFKQCPGVKILRVPIDSTNDHLKALQLLGELEELRLSFCTKITSLECLKLLPHLKRLSLRGCTKIVDFQPLSNSPLEYLDLSGNRKIQTLSFLENCRQLKQLDLYYSTGITSSIQDDLRNKLPKLTINI